MRGFLFLFACILTAGIDVSAQWEQSPEELEITREIDAAIGEGEIGLAWDRCVSALVQSDNDVSKQLILLDKGIGICLIENQPQLANELLMTAKSLGLDEDPKWKIRSLLRKAEIQFTLGNYDIMDSVHETVTNLLSNETNKIELTIFFTQRAIFAYLTHQYAAANEYIEAVLFDTEDNETSRSRAIVLMVLALVIEDQNKPDGLIESNLEFSRKIFERNNKSIEFYALLSKFLELNTGKSIRSVNNVILEHASKGDRFDSSWIKSVAYFTHAEAYRRQGEFEQSIDFLQVSQAYRESALIGNESRKIDWRQIHLQHFSGPNQPVWRSISIYWIIVTMLLIVLMLVLLQRSRTQRIINEKLIESIEKSRLAEQAAEHASKLKSQFVSNVSHEIKTPMSGLIGMTSLLEELIKDPAQKKYLATIRECSRNLLVLMNDLLDLGRIDADKLEIELAPFKLKDTLDYCEQIIRVRAAEKGLQLITDYDPNLPETIISDSTRLSQIILNLLNNAVQYTAAGRVEFKASCERAIGKAGYLTVVVSDTGAGIEPNRLQTVFEPFNQASSSTETNGHGSGLGLAISKRLTDHMGGTLSVISEYGKGTTFTLTLPVQTPQE